MIYKPKKNKNVQGAKENFSEKKPHESSLISRPEKVGIIVEPKKEDGLSRISSYSNICKEADETKIENIDDMRDLAFNTPQPIFYDCNNQFINVPNPYTSLVAQLFERILELSNGAPTREAFNRGQRNIYKNAVKNLKFFIRDTIQDTYTNALSNAIISFLTINIYNNISQRFLTSNIESALGFLFSPQNLDVYKIRDLIEDTEDILFNQDSLSIENKNTIILYNVNFVKTEIMSGVANGLNELARAMVFGANVLEKRPTKVVMDGANKYTRADVLREVFDKEESDYRDSTLLFWYIMQHFSIFMENLAPLIEALLWQVVSATNHLYSQEIFNSIKNYCDDPFYN